MTDRSARLMKTAVFYFSGTGNTLFIARELSRLLDGELIPIASTTGAERIATDADAVGIVYPVYYGELPAIVKEFARKLDGLAGKYVFAVGNYGGSPGLSAATLRKLLESGGGELAAFFGIHMPQNAFRKFWENNERIVLRSLKAVGKIARVTRSGLRGVDRTGLFQRLIIPLHGRFEPLYRKKMAQLTGEPEDADFDTMIRHSDRCFHTNGKCVGCRLCAKVCPVVNIKIKDGRPSWLGHCENCLACYNWCPEHAIDCAIPAKGYYYRNPKITAPDIMAQKNGAELSKA
jgi:flavodoxin/Pyruvate/2-oxoacid:ferredoxin oxidoreductase delta subunit